MQSCRSSFPKMSMLENTTKPSETSIRKNFHPGYAQAQFDHFPQKEHGHQRVLLFRGSCIRYFYKYPKGFQELCKQELLLL